MSAPPKIETVKVPMAPGPESAYAALNGVSIDWLRRAFHVSTRTAERNLKGVPVKALTEKGVPLYDLGMAAERLVRPRMDLTEYLKDIKVEDLPDALKETFWNAKLKQQRFEKNAGELWRTEAVIALFGSVLKDVKERSRMITTVAERAMSLTPEQLQTLRGIVNDFQGEVFNHIQQLESKTPSSVAELNREYGAEDDDPDYASPTVIKDENDGFEY